MQTATARQLLAAAAIDHLRVLEAESIHILREAAAQFERPVLLYSIGKDSSVMLHLARKAFFPAPIPFPLMHIDTGYKYPEMIAFRDWFGRTIGARLIVHTNRSAIADGVNPYDLGTPRCCGLLRTQALVDALREPGSTRRWAERAATRSGRAPRSASSRSAMRTASGIRSAAAGTLVPLQRPCPPGETHPRVSALELDRARRVVLHRSEEIPVVPLYFAQDRARWWCAASHSSSRGAAVRAAAAERARGDRRCRLRSLGCTPCTGAIESDADTVPQDRRGVAAVPPFGAREPRDRSRPGRVDGNEETGGLLLMATCCASPRPAAWTTASRRSSGGCCTTPRARLRRPLDAVAPASNRSAGPLDLSLLTDGLKAEREQGITIDVAYRHFATRAPPVPDRRYPRPRAVHAEHGDGRVHGRRGDHSGGRTPWIDAPVPPARLYRMAAGHPPSDGDQQDGPRGIRRACFPWHPRRTSPSCSTGADLQAIPISALHGDNVTVPQRANTRTRAPACCPSSRRSKSIARRPGSAFRLPVQLVIRPDRDFRGYAGQIASGTIRVGDPHHRVALRAVDTGNADRHVGRRA